MEKKAEIKLKTYVRLDATITQNIQTYFLNPKEEYKEAIIKHFIPLKIYYCFSCEAIHSKKEGKRKEYCTQKMVKEREDRHYSKE